MTHPSFEHVFRPLAIGPITAKNRIEVSPAEPFLCTKEGLVTNEFVDFTAAMARGGAAIVTVGDSPVTQAYADENHYVVNLADPFVVHGLTQVTEAVHAFDALASIELNLRADFTPGDLTVSEVRGIIDDFAAAAERCRKGGFDMVMLHGGHGHTVAQFFSPHFNSRTDQYGCTTFENRCRFARELIDAVRETIGSDMAIEYRISGDEKLSPDINVGIDEVLEFARLIQDRIDLLHVSAGNLYQVQTIRYMIQDTYMPRPTNIALARYLHERLHIPVTSVGSYTMELAEQALAEGAADMIAMIRPFVADHDQVVKARRLAAGSTDPHDLIRPCIRCNVCTGDDPHGCPKPLRCTVNPIAGLETRFSQLPPTEHPKRVAIVGGGCAGLETARWLAERGHAPIVLERAEQLGGTLLDAGANELKADVRSYAAWAVRTVADDPRIEARCSTQATPELLRELTPDALVVAVGGTPIVPNIPGLAEALEHGCDNDLETENGNATHRLPIALPATEADRYPERTNQRIAVIGAGLTGSETAAVLARMGRNVTLIDFRSRDELLASGRGIGIVQSMFEQEGGTLLDRQKLIEVADGGIVLESQETGERALLACDTVVLALGVRPRCFDDLLGICEKTYVIGDCHTKNGNITTAVRQAFDVAMRI